MIKFEATTSDASEIAKRFKYGLTLTFDKRSEKKFFEALEKAKIEHVRAYVPSDAELRMVTTFLESMAVILAGLSLFYQIHKDRKKQKAKPIAIITMPDGKRIEFATVRALKNFLDEKRRELPK